MADGSWWKKLVDLSEGRGVAGKGGEKEEDSGETRLRRNASGASSRVLLSRDPLADPTAHQGLVAQALPARELFGLRDLPLLKSKSHRLLPTAAQGKAGEPWAGLQVRRVRVDPRGPSSYVWPKTRPPPIRF